MERPRRDNRIFVALCINAAVLVLILFVVSSREGRVSFESAAFGQQQPPIAGGNQIYVMPAQLSPNTWGCYLMDVANQTLCVYQYSAGEKLLRLSAARTFKNDHQLGDFNTLPHPAEIKELVDREQEAQPAANPATPK